MVVFRTPEGNKIRNNLIRCSKDIRQLLLDINLRNCRTFPLENVGFNCRGDVELSGRFYSRVRDVLMFSNLGVTI